MLRSQASASLQEVSDFSVRIAGDFVSLNTSGLYSQALAKGQDISGRVLLLDSYGVVQVDSFSQLNGSRMMFPEVIEVLSGQKDISYGFHKITSEGPYFWAGYYVSAIVESSEVVGAVLFFAERAGCCIQCQCHKAKLYDYLFYLCSGSGDHFLFSHQPYFPPSGAAARRRNGDYRRRFSTPSAN